MARNPADEYLDAEVTDDERFLGVPKDVVYPKAPEDEGPAYPMPPPPGDDIASRGSRRVAGPVPQKELPPDIVWPDAEPAPKARAAPGGVPADIVWPSEAAAAPAQAAAPAPEDATPPSAADVATRTAAKTALSIVAPPVGAAVNAVDAVRPLTKDTEFEKGLIGSTIGTNPKLTGDAAEGFGVLLDNDTLQKAGKDISKFGQSQLDKYKPRVGSVADITAPWDNFGNFLSDVGAYAGYQTGSGIGSSLPSIVIGGVSAVATANPLVGLAIGALGPSYIQNYGDVYGSSRDDKDIAALVEKGALTRKDIAGTAALAAVPMAALDVVGLETILGKTVFAEAKHALAKRIIKGMALGAVTEGSTEGLQEIISQWTQDYLGSQTPMKQKLIAVIDNIFGGFFAGGAMGGAGGAAQQHAARPGATAPGPTSAEIGDIAPAGAVPADTILPGAGDTSIQVNGEERPDLYPQTPAIPVHGTLTRAVAAAPAPGTSPVEQLLTGADTVSTPVVSSADGSAAPGSLAPDAANAHDTGEGAQIPHQATQRSNAEVSTGGVTSGSPQPQGTVAPGGDLVSTAGAEVIAPNEQLRSGTDQRHEVASGDPLSPSANAPTGDGTRTSPVQIQTAEDVARAAAQAATDYSPEQGEANNRVLGHAKWNGLDASIEVAAGGVRKGTNPKTGEPWSTTHSVPYGYWKGTKGADGMHVDVYWGPHVGDPTLPAYVLDELDPDTGKFRQHKTFVGFASPQAATQAYLGTSSKTPAMVGGITAMPVDQFTDWVHDETKTTKRITSANSSALPKTAAQDKQITALAQPRGKAPASIIEFLGRSGGIDPKDPLIGDVRAILGTPNKFIPGVGMLIRPTGRKLDNLREAATEAGYLQNPDSGTTTVRHLLDLMSEEAHGRPSYSQADELAGRDREQHQARSADNEQLEAAKDEARDIAKTEGLHATDAEIEEAARDHLVNGTDLGDALFGVLERNAVAHENELAENPQRGVGDVRQAEATGTDAAGAKPAEAGQQPTRPDADPAPGGAQALVQPGAAQSDRGKGLPAAEGEPAGARQGGDGDVARAGAAPEQAAGGEGQAAGTDRAAEGVVPRPASSETPQTPSGAKPSTPIDNKAPETGPSDSGPVRVQEAKTVKGVPLPTDVKAEIDARRKKLRQEIEEGPSPASTEAGPMSNLPAIDLANALVGLIKSGRRITQKDLQEAAAKAYGTKLAEGQFNRKDMADALELAVNIAIKDAPQLRIETDKSWQSVMQRLDALLAKLPTQRVRSEEQESFQQFSTPPNYAAAAVFAANVRAGDVLLEPSAGTGSIVAAASNPDVKIIANELSERRVSLLRRLIGKDGEVFNENAEQIDNILDVKPSVVVMNPPFSQTAGRMGNQKVPMVAAEHIEAALNLLQPGGRLVAIVGRGMTMGAPSYRAWWSKIGQKYTVQANIGVDGKVYEKYGTTFGTRLLVIDKHQAEAGHKPVLVEAQTVDDLMRALEPIRDGRHATEQHAAEPGRADVAAPGEGGVAGAPSVPAGTGSVGDGERGGGRVAGDGAAGAPAPGGQPVRVEGGERAGVAPVEPERSGEGRAGANPAGQPQPGDQRKRGRGVRAQRDLEPAAERQPGAATGSERVELETADQAKPGSQAGAEINESLYQNYEPQRVRVKGAQPHPGPLVESASLKKLGAEAEAPKVTPQELYGKLMAGSRATLSNGWVLKRSRVAQENRIELVGPSTFSEGNEVKADGVFTERIDYKVRYFVPADETSGAATLARLTKFRTVTELGDAGDRAAASPTAGGDESMFALNRDQPAYKAGASTTVNGDTEFRTPFSGKFLEHAEAIYPLLRRELDRLGLKQTGLVLADRIELWRKGQLATADGVYFKNAITMALSGDRKFNVLHHEALHALRRLGVFTEGEWSILSRASANTWQKQFNIEDFYGHTPAWVKEEEGIAHAYAAWASGTIKVDGRIARLFKRIQQFFEGLRNALRGEGFATPESIFRDIKSGAIGDRASVEHQGPEPVFSVRSGDGDLFKTEIVQTPDGPREQGIIPGAEKITDKERAQRGADKPLRPAKPQKPANGLFEEPDTQLPMFAIHPRSSSLKGVEIDAQRELFEQLGLKSAPFWADYTHLAAKHPAEFANAAAAKVHIENVLSRPDWAIEQRNGYVDLVAMGGSDRLIGFRARLVGNRYKIATAYTLEAGQLDRMKEGATHAGATVLALNVQGSLDRTGPRQKVRSNEDESQSDEEPKFALNAPPATAIQRTNVMQGFLARGQFIDRAIRMPFDLFGGVTRDGQWKPGAKLFDSAANLITGAKFSVEGRFAFMNPWLEGARAGLVDRYGLDPAYVERERARSLDERAVMLQGAEILKTLKNNNVGPAEARVLQAILTGEDVTTRDMDALAEPIRAAIDQIGQEAVDLGMVSAESFERNRGTYLHRVYQKYEAEQNGLVRMVNGIMGSRRKKIIGDQFRGRGMFQDIALDRLMRDVPDWHDGARGKPENGEKFIRLDEMPNQAQLELDQNASPEKALRTVYWPAEKAIPDQYAGFTDQGTWQVRGTKAGKITIWRDFTKAEREKMGEIVDARYTIGKTFMLMAHDLSVGKFYKDIAENEAWTLNATPNERWLDAAEWSAQRQRLWKHGDVAWVKVPTMEIPNSGGKPRWGALSGRYVREEIWRDLNEQQIMSRPNVWRALLSQWKLNKTARSPVVHMNNVMSNFVLMDLLDVRFQDLAAGMRSYLTKDQHYEEAFKHGAFGADMMTQEVRDQVLKPVLEEIMRSNTFQQGGNLGALGAASKFTELLWSKVKAADKKMIDLYRVEDELFRMATYIRRRQLGDDAKQAADHAREQFIDYDIRAPWVNAARNTVLPFISYTYRAAPLVARAIATRPWKLAKYFALAYVANALAYALTGGDEDKERRALRDAEQGRTWVQTPRMMRMPVNDARGNPILLDVRRWTPAGDVFDLSNGDMPAWLNLGGPLMIGAELFLNRQAFTGQEIVNTKTDDLWDRMGKRGDHLYKSWVPSAAWVPGSWYWEKIENAAKGATDRQGNPYSVPLALSSSVGIKLKPLDVDDAMAAKAAEFRRVERELQTEARRLAGRQERNIISEAEFNKAIQRIIEKQGRNAEKAAETFK